MIVAIDGPSGVGKSTVAKAVAKRLGFSCLDTGAMYRALAWAALQEGVDLDDDQALAELAREKTISFGHTEGDPLPRVIYLDGIDISEAIRTQEVDKAVSPVSAAPSVREALVSQQQRIGSEGNYVVEGRDIGTVVFPDAEVKIFLTATAKERAHRRVRQNADRGFGSIDHSEVLKDLVRRDTHDSTREASPLKAAEDAHYLDTTEIYIEDVIEEIYQMAQEKIHA